MDEATVLELFRKLREVIKELWIEKQVCYNLVVDSNLKSKTELDQGLEAARHNPAYLRMAEQVFAGSGSTLAESEIEYWSELLSRVDPRNEKPN